LPRSRSVLVVQLSFLFLLIVLCFLFLYFFQMYCRQYCANHTPATN
jgi:hypothetical protein